MIVRILLLCLLPLALTGQPPGVSDLETVRQRVVGALLVAPVDTQRVSGLQNTLGEDGRWPDLNYQDTSRTGFEHGTHLKRMVDLALAFRKTSSPMRNDPMLGAAIGRAFTDWLHHDYLSENWWWNQIGTPDRLVNFLLIMDEAVSAEEQEEVDPIVSRANLNAWGARPGGDLIKIAGILGRYGLYLRDTTTINRAVNAMAGEIQLAVDRGTPDDLRGLQTDMSFQHRHDRVTSVLSYGLGYAGAFADWAEMLAGTRYQFPDSALHLLTDYYLDGIARSAAYGSYPDPGAKNRSLSRRGSLKPYGPTLPRQLAYASTYRRQELTELAETREQQTKTGGVSDRYYYNSTYHAHQRPRYFTSVRMYADRNHNMEVPYNEEGLKNHYLGDGANWLTVDGAEYLDIFPVLDFRKIPGTTVVQKDGLPPPDQIQQRGRTDFVGGVSDGDIWSYGFRLCQSPGFPAGKKILVLLR